MNLSYLKVYGMTIHLGWGVASQIVTDEFNPVEDLKRSSNAFSANRR